ncbi:type I polyketide synthase, partial [Streptomyces sp. NPDC059740]|uniref:type I polyketide synthase n=1 Tax=Streptomyces sp. NPDC059740 TaxID=3346926 RepID=UPI00364993CB
MACRLPGAASPQDYWRLLRDGVDAVGPAPKDRWPGVEDGLRRGGFLPRIDTFDAAFFGISPREAAMTDPQQRLVLELSWEALEDARIVPDALRASATGVFVGAIWDDYATLLYRRGATALDRHSLTGTHRSIIANRVSYTLGLQGPSLTVDTGQSSSLVAVHLACESLRRGESTTALVGGVNLNILAESTVGSQRFGGLSPDGRCHTFDARANGYVRGEGAGMVVLKPLAAALADGDRVYCVIAGSAVTNDGASEGLTVPTVRGQQEAVTAAYDQAGIDPATVQYVELHGTGTRVGDPVEAAALGAAVGRRHAPGDPLLVGSAKTNIGHLEGAAGIAGLLKTVLAVSRREIPASLHFATAHPDIPLADLGLSVPTSLTQWPHPERELVAGVSSFGMGGTNCHVVLTQAPVAAEPGPAAPAEPGSEVFPVLLSARTAAALRDQAARYRDRLVGGSGVGVGEVGWSSVVSRGVFGRRAVVWGGREGVVEGLGGLAGGGVGGGVVSGSVVSGGTV